MARRFLSVAIAGLIVAVTTGLVLSHARTPPLATTVPTGPSATLAANDWSVLKFPADIRDRACQARCAGARQNGA